MLGLLDQGALYPSLRRHLAPFRSRLTSLTALWSIVLYHPLRRPLAFRRSSLVERLVRDKRSARSTRSRVRLVLYLRFHASCARVALSRLAPDDSVARRSADGHDRSSWQEGHRRDARRHGQCALDGHVALVESGGRAGRARPAVRPRGRSAQSRTARRGERRARAKREGERADREREGGFDAAPQDEEDVGGEPAAGFAQAVKRLHVVVYILSARCRERDMNTTVFAMCERVPRERTS